jgi:phytoene dehydrogenase-like protein
MSERFDAVVVGSGPNGLAAAVTLARAGRSVLVLESQPTIGGGARSGELTLPGFVHDRCSAIHPMAAGSPFFRALSLDRYGLEWIHPELPVAHPLDEGSAAVLCRSLEETCSMLGRDGSAYRRLMAPLIDHWERLAEEFLKPMLHIPRRPLRFARFGLLAIQSAQRFARRVFLDEPARALFAGLAGHSLLPLDAAGSAAFGLVLGMVGHAVGWPLARGGSQKISDALAANLRELGGEIRTGCRVKNLGELPESRVVMLDVAVWQAARLASEILPARFRRRLERFPHGPGVFKLDYALDGPIPWRAKACGLAGTVHLGGTFAEIAAAERQVAAGEIPARPFVLLAQQSLFDSTRAPAGRHTVWAYCHVPFGCETDMTAAIEAQIERFAPGFAGRILARHTTSPAGFQASNENLAGGDISGGASHLFQLLARPTLTPCPYRLPAKGLYLCSSSTPPGAGVHGMCGYHAARAALARELR